MQEPTTVIGTSLLCQQKPEQSLKAFSKVAELLPDDPNSYLNLAFLEATLRTYTLLMPSANLMAFVVLSIGRLQPAITPRNLQ
jgi:hypothetical protein